MLSYLANLSLKYWLMGGMNTRIPSVATNDIQNAASSTAPGENSRIRNPAIESEVSESGSPEISIDKYTIKSIITDLVAETEKPVIARYATAMKDRDDAIIHDFDVSFFIINIAKPIIMVICIPLSARIWDAPAR